MKKREKKEKKIKQKVEGLVGHEFSKTDPLGSYTGKPSDPNSVPVQDADDL